MARVTPQEYVEEVLSLVERIPPGRVMSYGAVADSLADRSGRFSPYGWAMAVDAAYEEFGADAVVAETNYGGEMVTSVIAQVIHNVFG